MNRKVVVDSGKQIATHSENKGNRKQELQRIINSDMSQTTAMEEESSLVKESSIPVSFCNLDYLHNTPSCSKNTEHLDFSVVYADHSYSTQEFHKQSKVNCEKENNFDGKLKYENDLDVNNKNDFRECDNIASKELEKRKPKIKIIKISRQQKKLLEMCNTINSNIEKVNPLIKITKLNKQQKNIQEEDVSTSISKTGSEDRWWLKDRGPPYECKICGRTYGVCYRPFYVHVRSHRIHKLSCTFCDKKFTRIKMVEHMRSHTKEKPFVCDQCPGRFSTEGNLKRHLKVHTGEKSYICDICGKTFTQLTSLDSHIQAHAGKALFVCEYCGKTFTSDNTHRRHLYTHHDNQSTRNVIKPISARQQNKEGNNKTCKICGKVFSKPAFLCRHSRVHKENRQYTCNYCFKKFNSHLNYRIHSVWHHLQLEDSSTTKTKNWTCEFCDEMFDEHGDLVIHVLTHMERPYSCSTCGKRYITRMALLYHSRQHADVKRHTCKVCGKKFGHIGKFRQHFRIHTGEKPYKCKVCSRLFSQRQQLVSHMLTHTGEKRHICPYCGKKFALNGNLTVHKRRHTGEKPYICEMCGKGFYDSSALKKHKQLHKRNEEDDIDADLKDVKVINILTIEDLDEYKIF